MRILYLDCFSGISGDMTLAALVDAGADALYVEQELGKLQSVEPFTLEWKRVVKRGISSLKLDVLLDPNHPPTHHRHYADIVRMINAAGLSPRATALALAIFEKIGVAEGKIHGIPLDQVHFHEVGAIDSIVDVVGVALALDSLGVERIYSSPVPLGSGTVNCDHGIYPVPAPATLEMMKGLPIAPTQYQMEMTTPTGAGIIAGVVDEFAKGFPPMIVEAIGYGAGTRELPNQPNVLRAVVGRSDPYMTKWQLHHDHALEPHNHDHHHHHEDHHHHHGERDADGKKRAPFGPAQPGGGLLHELPEAYGGGGKTGEHHHADAYGDGHTHTHDAHVHGEHTLDHTHEHRQHSHTHEDSHDHAHGHSHEHSHGHADGDSHKHSAERGHAPDHDHPHSHGHSHS